MMNNFWNERFAAEEYIYGTRPNLFLKKQLAKLTPGKILFPGEGEGRNAVYAATRGWDVTAFDSSIEGKRKAEKLATAKGVKIDYSIAGYETVQFPEEKFDCIVLIFTHMPSVQRNANHKKFISYLKPGGTLILEAFSKRQIKNSSGGPGNIDMLFAAEELKKDFDSLKDLEIFEAEYQLDEGPKHQGNASVIRVIGVK